MTVAVTPEVRALSDRYAAFGLELFRRLPPDGNTFYSPLSVAAALAALLPGARGETAEELAHALGIPATEGPSDTAAALLAALEPRAVEEATWDAAANVARYTAREVLRLTLATGLFVEEGLPLHTSFCEEVRTAYGADFQSVLFGEPVTAAARINGWVAERTEGRIERLVTPAAVEHAALVLVNAVYFNGEWTHPFEAEVTTPAPFHLGGATGRTVEVPTMALEATLPHWAAPDGSLRAAVLPYQGGASMVVLLPVESGLASVEKRLSPALLGEITAGRTPQLLDLRMPRLEMRASYGLADVLQAMGIRAAFDPGVADFRGITPAASLVLSDVVHQAWVRVDEAGTEAAAATAAVMLATGLPGDEPEPLPFVVDRPFLFVIRDEATGAILFAGRVRDPTA